jgi:hypothetical protein
MTTVVRSTRQTVVVRGPAGGAQGPPGPAGSGSTIGVKDEGTLLSAIVERVNYVGAGVSVAGTGADVTVTVPGGGIGINVRDYGATGNGTTDDSSAFTSAIAALKAAAVNSDGFYKGSSRLYVPPGHYYLGTTTLDITHTLIIEGDGNGMAGGMPTKLRWSGATGIRVQDINTTGATGTQTAVSGTTFGGAGTIIRGLALIGAYSGTEAEYHGIHLRTNAIIEDVFIDNFAGDGIHIVATVPANGNANTWQINRTRVQRCRNGLFADSSDSNAGTAIGFNTGSNRQWGWWDSSFLSNNCVGGQSDANGIRAGSYTPSVVSDGGNWYSCAVGQETGASTNRPPTSTVTITIASPSVVTWTAHGLAVGTEVAFSTTGALPTGLSQNTPYYVVNPTTNTFQVAASVGGAAINTSGSQSGTHRSGAGTNNQWWLYVSAGGPDTTSFNVPAWVSGTTYRSGGSYCIDNASSGGTLLGCYSESGQGKAQLYGSSIAVGSNVGIAIAGPQIFGRTGTAATYGAMEVQGLINQLVRTRVGSGESTAEGLLQHFNATQIGNAQGALTFGWHAGIKGILHWTNWSNYYGLDESVFQISTDAAASSDAPWGANRMNFPQGFGLGDKKILSGTAAPASGAYLVGDIVYNSAPAAAGKVGWVCTTAGSPGTWKAFGVIDA